MYQAFSSTQAKLNTDEIVPDYAHIQKVVYEIEEQYKHKGFIKTEGPESTAAARKDQKEKERATLK